MPRQGRHDELTTRPAPARNLRLRSWYRRHHGHRRREHEQHGSRPTHHGRCRREHDWGTDDVPVAERKRVFYFRNGSLGKILDSADTRPAVEAADEDCTNGAAEMGLGGMWRAWLSTSQVDAIDRFEDVGPWYRVDQETLLFASKAELALGPRAPIDLTFDDPNRMDDELFWSGTDLDGHRTDNNCSDWTIYNVPAVATVGRADISGPGWVAAEPLLCSTYLALLCIEQ